MNGGPRHGAAFLGLAAVLLSGQLLSAQPKGAGMGGQTSAVTAPSPVAQPNWLTGPALQQRLARAIDLHWSGTPLRQAMHGFSRSQGVAVLIDRRVDPEQRVDLRLSSVPVREVPRKIAEKRQLDVSWLDSVAYLGPRDAASRLRTLAALCEEGVRKLPPGPARKFQQRKPLAWEDFAAPKDLLSQLAKDSGIEILGLEQVPHDLWAAADLPALSLIDRITLIAVQFDLTFEAVADGRRIRLVRVADDVALTRSYPSGTSAAATADRFATLAPQAKIKAANGKVWVRALLEDHERIAVPRPAAETAKPPAAPRAEKRIDRLVVQEKPVGKVLEALAAQLHFELRMDREAIAAAGVSLEQRVSVQLQNPTLDEVLGELLKSTRLTFRRQGGVVEVKPR